MKADSSIVVNAIVQPDPNLVANSLLREESILIPLGAFLMTTIICALGIYYSYRKRAIYAEKGYSADDITKIFGAKRKSFFTMKRNGIILIGVALGFFSGSFVREMTGQYFWFTPLLLLGIGLGLYYASKVDNKEE